MTDEQKLKIVKICKDALLDPGSELAKDVESGKFNASDWSGGNYDDAAELGERIGAHHLATKILGDLA